MARATERAREKMEHVGKLRTALRASQSSFGRCFGMIYDQHEVHEEKHSCIVLYLN